MCLCFSGVDGAETLGFTRGGCLGRPRNIQTRVKVVAYERAGTRIQQTTELRGPLPALLKRLQVPPPPALHAISPAPAPAGA